MYKILRLLVFTIFVLLLQEILLGQPNNVFFARPWPIDGNYDQKLFSYTSDQKLCGWIEYRPNDGWISELLVDKKYQGQGIGTSLLTRALEKIFLYNEAAEFLAFESAQGFYEKIGARLIEGPQGMPSYVPNFEKRIVPARLMKITRSAFQNR